MAIIVTPKGWAIEFETPDWQKNSKLDYIAANQADWYVNVLNGLLEVVRIANDDTKTYAGSEINYWVFGLIEKMLPTGEDAKAFFLERLNKQKHPNT